MTAQTLDPSISPDDTAQAVKTTEVSVSGETTKPSKDKPAQTAAAKSKGAAKPAASVKSKPKSPQKSGSALAFDEAQAAAKAEQFVLLSELIKDAKTTEHAAFLHDKYLLQLSAGMVYAIPLTDSATVIVGKDEPVTEELIADTPTFKEWRTRVDIDYRVEQLKDEGVGFTKQEATKHFSELAKARFAVLKK